MAFVNEVLTPEQKEEFLSWNLKRPIFMAGRILNETPMFAPFRWTVDKERNMYLLETSYDPDFPYEEVFLFIWNGKNYLVQFTWVVNGNSRAWNIPEKYMIDDVFPYCTEEHFLDDLREALLVYSKSRPKNQGPGIQIICNF